MPIILRALITIPVYAEDGSSEDASYATLAFCHDDGRQYSQISVLADAVEEFEEGATLQLAEVEDGAITLIERVTIGENEYAAIAFLDGDGNPYARLHIDATEVDGISDGATLQLESSEAELSFSIPSDLTQMIQSD